ncbi:MAG: hypothetical protein F8N39_11510 [Clostridiaceae bacterium]|nr:hypothetical protein [Clostridiaceae bacterium]
MTRDFTTMKQRIALLGRQEQKLLATIMTTHIGETRIVIEGPQGAGKTTLRRAVEAALVQGGAKILESGADERTNCDFLRVIGPANVRDNWITKVILNAAPMGGA